MATSAMINCQTEQIRESANESAIKRLYRQFVRGTNHSWSSVMNFMNLETASIGEYYIGSSSKKSSIKCRKLKTNHIRGINLVIADITKLINVDFDGVALNDTKVNMRRLQEFAVLGKFIAKYAVDDHISADSL